MPVAGIDCIQCQLAFPAPVQGIHADDSHRFTLPLPDQVGLGAFPEVTAFTQPCQVSKTLCHMPVLVAVSSCLQQVGFEQSKTDNVLQNVSTCLKQVVEIPKRTNHRKSKNATTREGKTMMICNIPCRVSHADLTDAIGSIGLSPSFIHLPCRPGCHSNLGYGFVHFPCQADAERFALAFKGYRFNKESAKECIVKVADQQGHNGRHKLLARYLQMQAKSS